MLRRQNPAHRMWQKGGGVKGIGERVCDSDSREAAEGEAGGNVSGDGEDEGGSRLWTRTGGAGGPAGGGNSPFTGGLGRTATEDKEGKGSKESSLKGGEGVRGVEA